MLDDQSLVIDVDNKVLVVVSGFAHSGIISTIKYVQEITESSKVHAVLGGFHLANADVERIRATVDEFKKFDPEFIGPCHCTAKKLSRNLPKFSETAAVPFTSETLWNFR